MINENKRDGDFRDKFLQSMIENFIFTRLLS